MIEYFLVICMITVIEDRAFESTGSPRVECHQPLERRGPHPDEQACIKSKQALGMELGLNERGKTFIAMCDGEYREVPYAPAKRQQQGDSEREHQRAGPLRQATRSSRSHRHERGWHREETA